MKIAQHFSAGNGIREYLRPVGTHEPKRISSVPTGRNPFFIRIPSTKVLGYFPAVPPGPRPAPLLPQLWDVTAGSASNPRSAIRNPQSGFTLAGALVIIAVLAIFMALSVPLWSRIKQRDNEAELVFRGKEYAEAIGRYQAKFGTYPPDLDTLLKLKLIRKLYKDPMTKSGKWKILTPESLVQTGAAGKLSTETKTGGGGKSTGVRTREELEEEDQDMEEDKSDEEPETEVKGPVVAVVSRSKKASIKLFDGQSRYNQWKFAPAQQQVQQQPPGGQPAGGKPGGLGNQPGGTNIPPGRTGSSGGQPPPQPPNGDDDDD